MSKKKNAAAKLKKVEAVGATNSSPPQKVPDAAAPKNRGKLFQPGQSGNPSGKPKGLRNKLCHSFIWDLYSHWQEHGKEAIERVCRLWPVAYLKIVASTLRKQLDVRINELHELSDSELDARIAALTAALREGGADDPFGGEGEPEEAEQIGAVPPIH